MSWVGFVLFCFVLFVGFFCCFCLFGFFVVVVLFLEEALVLTSESWGHFMSL